MADRAAAAGFRTFGDAATYTPPAGSPVAVTVVRRSATEESAFLSTGFRGTAWEADLRASEVAAPVKGAVLVIGAETFEVVNVRQDASARVFTLALRET